HACQAACLGFRPPRVGRAEPEVAVGPLHGQQPWRATGQVERGSVAPVLALQAAPCAEAAAGDRRAVTDPRSAASSRDRALAGTAWADFGGPLGGLTAAERARFTAGRQTFKEVEGVADGLGPVFNADSCAACHNVGATGGGSERVETRFGRTVSGAFDPMTS